MAQILGVIASGAERTADDREGPPHVLALDEAHAVGSSTCARDRGHPALLRPRWTDRITIHRDYERLPPVECDAGQMNQVFMNVLVERLRRDRRARQHLDPATVATARRVAVAIRDDGAGIAPEHLPPHLRPVLHHQAVGQGTGPRARDRPRHRAAATADDPVDERARRGHRVQIVLPLRRDASRERGDAYDGRP